MTFSLKNVTGPIALMAFVAQTAAISLGQAVPPSNAAPAPVAQPSAGATTFGPPAPARPIATPTPTVAAAPAPAAPVPPAPGASAQAPAASAAPAAPAQSAPAPESAESAPAPLTLAIPAVNISIPGVHIPVPPIIDPAYHTGARIGGFFKGIGAGFSQLVRPD